MSNNTHRFRRGEALDDESIRSLRALAERHGVPAAARAIGIATSAYARAVAGLPVLRGTAALAREGLAALRPHNVEIPTALRGAR